MSLIAEKFVCRKTRKYFIVFFLLCLVLFHYLCLHLFFTLKDEYAELVLVEIGLEIREELKRFNAQNSVRRIT